MGTTLAIPLGMVTIAVLITATLAGMAAARAAVARAGLVLGLSAAGCGSPPAVEATPPPTPTVTAPADASLRAHPRDDDKHLVFEDELDGGFAPVNHTEMLWGDYIDKQGNPAVGWHSHDPVTGNAQ